MNGETMTYKRELTQAVQARALAEGAATVIEGLLKLSIHVQRHCDTAEQRLKMAAEQFAVEGTSLAFFEEGPSPLVQWIEDIAHPGIKSVEIDDHNMELFGYGSTKFTITIPFAFFDSAVYDIHFAWGTDAYPYKPLALVK